MATTVQSNPTYYSLSSFSSGLKTSNRDVILQRRINHDGFGIYIGEDVPSGLYIVTVERGSPAAEANLQPGDRIVAINGQSLSMIRNPKEVLVQAASNSSSLQLTVQTTNIFEELDIPLTNSYRAERKPSGEKAFTQPKVNTNPDLESYIRSIFANENVQLVPSSNMNEFILYRNHNQNQNQNEIPKHNSYSPPPPPQLNSYPPPPQLNSYPPYTSHSKPHKEHRHRHRHSKRKILVTKETQTSMDEDEDGYSVQEPLPTPTIPQQPSMGTSHRLLRTQKSSVIIPTVTIASQSQANPPARRSTDITPDQRTQHMANIVEAAMAAQRKREATQTREESSPRTSVAVVPLIVTPQTPTQPRQAEPVAAPSEPKGSPPPYADKESQPKTTANNRTSTNEGTYNVRNAQENRNPAPSNPNRDVIPPPITGPNVRVVHLSRTTDFQGFGFHVQYNKSYFLVHKIEEASPAQYSGLQVNDVILAINQQITENMPHATFVQQVGECSDVDFVVQPFDDYLHSNFRGQNKPLAASTSGNENVESGANKLSLSNIKNKLTSR